MNAPLILLIGIVIALAFLGGWLSARWSYRNACGGLLVPLDCPTTLYIDDDAGGKGNNETGDGSYEKPFLTIERAHAAGADIVRDMHSQLMSIR